MSAYKGEREKNTVRIPVKYYNEFRRLCQEKGKSFNDGVTDLIIAYVDKEEERV